MIAVIVAITPVAVTLTDGPHPAPTFQINFSAMLAAQFANGLSAH
jgi:hypothetical protein